MRYQDRGLSQDVEVTGDQYRWLIQIVRVAPHQAAIGEAVADRLGQLLLGPSQDVPTPLR
jgi:hypothetical protein